jgi:hypothetical protein
VGFGVRVQHIETTPADRGVSRLAGAPAMSGFRAAVDRAAPQLRQRRELLYTLLDDSPVATLISGHALSASGVLGVTATSGYLPVADQCAGFVSAGLLLSSFEAGDPAIVTGPTAPVLDDPEDPQAWHPMAPLPVHGIRRRRRFDVTADECGATVGIDAMFRDTYVRGDGQETIIHEYTLTATVDADTGVILGSDGIAARTALAGVPGRGRQCRQNHGDDVE